MMYSLCDMMEHQQSSSWDTYHTEIELSVFLKINNSSSELIKKQIFQNYELLSITTLLNWCGNINKIMNPNLF